MIVQMRKLDLLLYHKEREKFLEDLRVLGVVHITAEKPVESPVVQELGGVVHLAERVISSLRKIQKEKELQVGKTHLGEPTELLHRFEDLESKKERIDQEIASLVKDKTVLEPWGNFKPESVKRLGEVGLTLKFYSMPVRKFDTLDKSKYGIEVINRRETAVYFVVITRGGAVEIPGAEEVRLPDASLNDVEEKIAKLNEDRKSVEQTIEKMIGCIDELEQFRNARVNQLRFEKARLSMMGEADGKLLKLSGWVPQDKETKLAEFLSRFPAYYTFRDPYEDEDVPVKLKNKRFPSLFEPITGLYALPTYTELDMTPFMAPFFAVFFGLCLGDLGYGLVLFTGALIARAKLSPKLKPFMSLGIVLGLATMISGVLLNSFFGATIFGGEGIAEGTSIFPTGVQFFAPLSAQTGEAGQVFPAMSLALLLGFIQVLFGIGIQSYLKMKYQGWAAGLQPIGTMFMLVSAIIMGAHSNFLNLGIGEFKVGPVNIGALLLQVPMAAAQGLFILGIFFFMFFNNLEKKIFFRPLTGLWDLYNLITGFLGNILSYLRLFALGLAGGLLGAAFNQIAFMFITTESGEINYASVGIIGTILVLVLGHSLNLALSSIGAFVHPLRLTFVEFYSNVGFKGGSKPFVPFSKVE